MTGLCSIKKSSSKIRNRTRVFEIDKGLSTEIKHNHEKNKPIDRQNGKLITDHGLTLRGRRQLTVKAICEQTGK